MMGNGRFSPGKGGGRGRGPADDEGPFDAFFLKWSYSVKL